MKRTFNIRISGLLILSLFLFGSLHPCSVHEVKAQSDTLTPYDVISAVNVLRASYGLSPLETDSTLMSIAQSHSQYQAAVGNWTHYSADGTNPQGRAKNAGYGGGRTIIVSENVAEIWSGQNFTVSDLIYDLWSDDVHWNTMINPQYIQAGAGVAEADGVQYITLDVGYIAGVSAASTAVPLETAASSAYSTATASSSSSASATATSYTDVVIPVQASTAQPDGSIYHIVQPGQVLLTIAQIYGVEVNELAALNDVSPDSIYAGDQLTIRMPFTPTIALPSSTPIPITSQPTVEWTTQVESILATNQALTVTATPNTEDKPPTIPMSRTTLGIIITVVVGLLALLGLNYIHTK